MKFKKIAAGEYEFKGGFISKDEYESGLWWVTFDGFNTRYDAYSYKQAKQIVIDSFNEGK